MAALVLLVVGGTLAVAFAGPSLSADSSALAKVGMPLGGGSVKSVSVVSGPHSSAIPVQLRGGVIWPTKLIPAHQTVSLEVVVRRPGWISWLTGSTERLKLTLLTPSATLEQHYLTVSGRGPLTLRFKQPVSMFSYGASPSKLERHELVAPLPEIKVPRTADAGSVWVAAAPRSWESAKPAVVSWFPAGGAAAAVASPAPGSTIGPTTPISLTFSSTVDQALGSARPPVSPTTPGTWHTQGSHTIVFVPEGAGYGLGARVDIPLPKGIKLVAKSGDSETGSWKVPAGSTLRLQQMLALLGYLPLRFHYQGQGVPLDPAAQETAALHPPQGHFTWRYDNVPDALRSFWQPGSSGVMTSGALMAFENDHGLTPDGSAGPAVWRALIRAVIGHHKTSFGYTFVSVSEGSQTLTLWHNGKTVLTTAVNTGIASAPTATGTYPVYEHIASGTMSGNNPDGSHYNDPGIPWISYFNGGDALHGFTRAQYGSPQSLGCVEMPVDTAGKVWPYTPVGTLVHVA